MAFVGFITTRYYTVGILLGVQNICWKEEKEGEGEKKRKKRKERKK